MKAVTATRTMLGWSTKYALTRGIERVEVQPGLADPTYVYTVSGLGIQLVVGHTFFESEQDAIRNAIQQARRKIESRAKETRRLLAYIEAWRAQGKP